MRISRLESILLLVMALVCDHLIQYSYETRSKQINWRQEKKAGKRLVDALTGNCGKFSANDSWNERKDAFCDKEAGTVIEGIKPVGNGEFPSYVLLEIDEPVNLKKCSGVLVHNDSILTANTCITSKAISLRATVGIVDAGAQNGTQKSFAWGYCRLFNKQKYDKNEDNNVVMVLLRKPFSLNERVQPACVELNRTRNDQVNCYVTGMGKKKDSNETELQSVPFLPCEPLTTKNWDQNDGHCFVRNNTADQQLDKDFIVNGSGLYCLDKCDGSVKVFAVGIVARQVNIEQKEGGTVEVIHVSKTEQFKAPTEGMLQNCFEFVKDEVQKNRRSTFVQTSI